MIQSGYNPQGGNQLSTSTMGLPPLPGASGLPFDPTAALREKLRIEADQRAFENQMREREMQMRQRQMQMQQKQAAMQEQGFNDSRRYQDQDRARMTNHPATQKGPDPLSAVKRMDQYEASLRGASMRPTGLGAQMIPGMASDPNLLPSRLRPQGASFQGGMDPSRASLSPGAPMAPPTSNRGFDFADPYSQAQVQQASFGRR